MHQQFIDKAVQLAAKNVAAGGKPFGAVIVANGVEVASGVNEAAQTGDLTAHAEIQAMRTAAQAGKADLLQGAAMYASGHPCPMCLAAMYLTGFEKIFYHNSLEEVEGTSLDVKPVYRELQKPFGQQQIPLVQLPTTVNQQPVEEWLYDRGTGNLLATVRFKDGRVLSIRYGRQPE